MLQIQSNEKLSLRVILDTDLIPQLDFLFFFSPLGRLGIITYIGMLNINSFIY